MGGGGGGGPMALQNPKAPTKWQLEEGSVGLVVRSEVEQDVSFINSECPSIRGNAIGESQTISEI